MQDDRFNFGGRFFRFRVPERPGFTVLRVSKFIDLILTVKGPVEIQELKIDFPI